MAGADQTSLRAAASAPSGGSGSSRSPALARGDEVEVRVDTLAYGGRGIARHDGFVVFVEGGLPGDRLLARITKRRRGFAEAVAVELLEPGADRVEAVCMHAGSPCPGAPWQTLRYERQLEHKQAQVRDSLSRLGGFDGFEPLDIVPAASRWRYRNKLEFSFGGTSGAVALGYHRRSDWRTVVDVEDCLLASTEVNAARNQVRDWCSAEGLEPYDRETGSGFLRNLVVREGRRTGQRMLRLVAAEGRLRGEALAREVAAGEASGVTSLLLTRNVGVAELARGDGDVLLGGHSWIEERLAGISFRIRPDSFFQTNTEMAERIVDAVREAAALGGHETVFDLYCGIGSLGLALAPDAGHVYGVDVVEQAVASAIETAELNGVEDASFFAGNARTAIRPLIEKVGSADVAVVDPPRAGLSQKVVRRVLETDARRIVYVSCNPTTLAPNLRQMVDGGYCLDWVRPIDMFPMTPHIECVAALTRNA